MQDVFDALFAILMDDPDKYGELISDAVVSSYNKLLTPRKWRYHITLAAFEANLLDNSYLFLIFYAKRCTEEDVIYVIIHPVDFLPTFELRLLIYPR